jgi:hypothetical protein
VRLLRFRQEQPQGTNIAVVLSFRSHNRLPGVDWNGGGPINTLSSTVGLMGRDATPKGLQAPGTRAPCPSGGLPVMDDLMLLQSRLSY